MRIISATILDPTHLQLSQPIALAPGQVIEIAVRDSEDAELRDWQSLGKARMLEAYADEDAVYDKL
jgi:hypothetical protein